MSSRIKLIIGILVFTVAAAAAISGTVLSSRVPLNDEGVIGNSPGNIANGGYFCELNGKVYFSNAYENHTLFSMLPDETKVRRLGSMGVKYICGAGKFLFFFMDSSESSGGKGLGYVGNTFGIYRMRLSDNKTKSLERVRLRQMQLCGSYLYFAGDAEDSSGTFKLRIDKKERRKLSDSMILPAGYDGRYLYYAGASDDPSLFYFHTGLNDRESKLLDGNISSPIPTEDYIFYIDNAAGYRICRMDRQTGAVEQIGMERVDCFNTNGRYIWYAVSAEGTPAIKRMLTDGGNVEIIASGVYNSIHYTSRYLYFSAYDKGGTGSIYHVPVEATGPVAVFTPQE